MEIWHPVALWQYLHVTLVGYFIHVSDGMKLRGKPKKKHFSEVTHIYYQSVCFTVCDDPVAPQNGIVTSNGTLAVYTCDTGYSLSEWTQRDCADDGTGWSGTQPLCGE